MSNTPNARPRRVCYLAPDVPIPYPSGAAVHVAEVANSLHELGHDVHIIARRTSSSEPEVEPIDGVVVHRVSRFVVKPGGRRSPSRKQGSASTGLVASLYHLYLRTLFMAYVSLIARREIKRYGLEAIVERETAFGAGGLASLLTGKPLVLEIVGPRYSRLSARVSSSILYYNDSMLHDWVDRKKCVKVAAGVNLGLFRPDSEARRLTRLMLRLGEEPVVGYVGSFQGWHGVDAVLNAVSSLKGNGSKLVLLLVGPFFERYVGIAKELGINDSCVFIGSVDYKEVPAYINACDILVAPYDPSKDPLRTKFGIGFPIKVLEYMACEKPVISTNVPPVDSILGNSNALVLVEPGDASSLAEAISDLIHNPEEARRIAENGFRVVKERYSWTSISRVLSSKIAAA